MWGLPGYVDLAQMIDGTRDPWWLYFSTNKGLNPLTNTTKYSIVFQFEKVAS
jgi:hypothetical protein